MRTIRISNEVWDEIAKRGKFGETPDDVLRRVFKIDDVPGRKQRVKSFPRGRQATKTMSPRIVNDHFIVEFEDGASERWMMPSRDDKAGIRRVRDLAVEFARHQGASHGQLEAVKKKLTEAGYHLTK